jgi:hypothetical protein
LTTATLEDFKSHIPFSALSKTFQEAIIVVRNLGYKYIWIDSLCIIQDSREDWGHESEFMGGIYRNSICTIAATASKDGDCGCFRLRNTLRSGPCQLWGNELHRICVDIENDTVDRRYRREVNGGPLNTRAWVLQERVLSPRIIHYSESTVYWDCREAHFLDSGRSISDERSLSLGFEGGDARLFDTTSSTFKKDFSDHWKFSVEKYCEMKLTVESDRLIAFMGITKYVEEATGNQKCKFGLWTHYLLEHMLWRIQDASSISTIGRTTSEIPSWSWASHHGHIRYFPPNKEDTATTFWYPESEGGWKRDAPLDIDDPSLVENIVADISRQMELGVDPETGYLSNKVYCSTVIEECSSERLVCLSGKLNVTSGAVMILRDAFQAEEETAIMNSLRIGDNSVGYRRLVCIWLDYPMNPLPIDLVYLRIYVQGAQRPKVERFLNLSGSNGWDGTNKTLLAPYALHTIGLILLPTGQADQYRRVGFFRAIETLGVSPAPHPKGVDPENPFFKNCWFGEDCATRKLMIV